MANLKTVGVTALKKEINWAIKECKKELKDEKRIGNHSACIDLSGKIYAYEYVRDCLIIDAIRSVT